MKSESKRLFGLRPVIFFAGLVSLFTDLSSEMIVPILPLFLTSVLQVQVGAVGLIEGIAESTASVLKLFSGWLSDKMGRRKPLMLWGYGLSNLAKPLFALTNTWGAVLSIRFVDRFGKGIRGAPRDALLADASTTAERGKAFGFHRAMDTAGAAIGPFTAFAVLEFFHGNFRTVFWLSAIPGIVAFVVLAVFVKEARGGSAPAGSTGAVERRTTKSSSSRFPQFAFRQLGRRFIVFSLISTLFSLGNSSDAFLVLRAQNVGMTAALIPLAYFAFNVTYTIFAIPAGMLSDRIGRRRVLIAGYVVFALIYIGFAAVQAAIWIWPLFLLYGLYYAAIEGVQKAYVADMVGASQRGKAMGTFNALIGIAALPASIVAGYLWQAVGPYATFLQGSVGAVAAALLIWLMRA